MNKDDRNYTSVDQYYSYSLPELKARLVDEFEKDFDQIAEAHKDDRMFLSFVAMRMSSLVRHAGYRADALAKVEGGTASAETFLRWARMPTWTQEEAASLMAGIEPKAMKDIPWEDVSSLADTHHAARSYVDVLVVLRRAGCSQITPAEMLTWADQFQVPMPEGLRTAITGMWLKPAAETSQEGGASKSLRTDREQTLLRVIAGLWALSGLPEEPTTTADKISALFDGWSWEKPTKATIAETVLARAAKLDRIPRK